jgi:uncharacterized protein YjbI with pentapeptide repeats
MNECKHAHRYSSRNREQIARSSICGCFTCRRIYPSEKIQEWIDEWNRSSITALCPYCGIDTVIGSASGFPITDLFLDKMYQHWVDGNASGDELPLQKFSRQAHLPLLKQGVAAWNQWRSTHRMEEPNLVGTDLSQQSFDEMDLDDANLEEAHLSSTSLANVFLRGANLKHACLQRAFLYSADLKDTDFCCIDGTQANFSWANVSEACFLSANLQHALLINMYGFRINASDANFSRVNAIHAQLTDSMFLRANISDANFSHVDGSDTDFSFADLHQTNFQHAVLRDARFCNADLSSVDFFGADLTNVDFRGAKLEHANLQNANLQGTKFD